MKTDKKTVKLYEPYFPEFWQKHEKKLKSIGKKNIKSLFLYEFVIDNEGIILFKQKFFEGKKLIYQPITIIQTALDLYNDYCSDQDEIKKMMFLKYAEKASSLLTGSRGGAAFYSTVRQKIAGYKFKKPYRWTGCMENGMFLSVLIRAHSITNEKKYLLLAKKLLPPFEIEVGKGGFRSVDRDGNWWYEEFGAEISRHHVLNGFVYALLGLHEYYEYTKETKAKNLFERGIKTLDKNLGVFDINLLFFLSLIHI